MAPFLVLGLGLSFAFFFLALIFYQPFRWLFCQPDVAGPIQPANNYDTIYTGVSDKQKDPNAYTFHAFDQQEKTKSEWPSTANPSSGLRQLSPTHHLPLKDALKFVEDASELGYRTLTPQEHAPSTLSQLHAPLASFLSVPYSGMEDDVGVVGEGGGGGGRGEAMVELEDWLLN
ncbi:hypothetical protein EI94DRAFT_1702091 [Lactarius quietus]|nr:hypothetical protein EI94DRAFT_1702091 [Lactarius quietus]